MLNKGKFDKSISICCSTVYLVPKQCYYNRFVKPKYMYNCNKCYFRFTPIIIKAIGIATKTTN